MPKIIRDVDEIKKLIDRMEFVNTRITNEPDKDYIDGVIDGLEWAICYGDSPAEDFEDVD